VDAMIYTAPVTGYYRVSMDIRHYAPTGRDTLQENYSREWWQFWKPKMVMRPEYREEIISDGVQVKLLEKGQAVTSSFGIVRL
jgi:hypothetical protein